jgi:hypothetical protein
MPYPILRTSSHAPSRPLTATGLAGGNSGFIGIIAGVGQRIGGVFLYSNVAEEGDRRAFALDFDEAGVIPHALAAVADDSSIVHDDAGVSRRRLPAGLDDDVAGGGFSHVYWLETGVMCQGVPENRGAEDISRFRTRYDVLVCCLCEYDGYGGGVFGVARGWA